MTGATEARWEFRPADPTDWTAGRIRAVEQAVERGEYGVALRIDDDRNSRPLTLASLFDAGLVHGLELQDLLQFVWTSAGLPRMYIDARKWVELFRSAAFDPPLEPARLYRGATIGEHRGLAWSTNIDVARRFANRNAGTAAGASGSIFGGLGAARGVDAAVYATSAAPYAVLAHFNQSAGGDHENEVVVDPAMLDRPIETVELIPSR